MAEAVQQGASKIVDSARTLFRQKGFHQTSMKALSSFAGVSVGQIYRLFRNKEAVIAAIIRGDTQTLTGRLNAIHEAVISNTISVRDGFKAAVIDAFQSGNDALTFEILAEASRNPTIDNEIAALLGKYRATLRKLIMLAEYTMTEERLNIAEEMLMALLFGLGSRPLCYASCVTDKTADNAADMILTMLRTKAS
ncbi:TetR/AcrR family transcriptional regulator [Sphingomonas bisphenolicum]